MIQELSLAGAGLIAGFIDSIAGGGGLITLPALTLVLGPGAPAVGTNKIVGTVGALAALIVYRRKKAVPVNKAMGFMVGIIVGSFTGSRITPYLDRELFSWILIAACPFILTLILTRQLWIAELSHHAETFTKVRHLKILLTGLACGLYDGAFGPGGGTFMLLGLIYANGLPLFEALVLSKLANTFSAGTSLISYAQQGFVHIPEGCAAASGILIGSISGARWASKRAEKVVRPMLVFVVLLFLSKLLWDKFSV